MWVLPLPLVPSKCCILTNFLQFSSSYIKKTQCIPLWGRGGGHFIWGVDFLEYQIINTFLPHPRKNFNVFFVHFCRVKQIYS